MAKTKAKPFQNKKRRRRTQHATPVNKIFVGSSVPYTKFSREVANHGTVRFHGFEYPFLDSEQRRPRVWLAYMTLGEHQLILGYVWKQTGADWWKARQPNGPWRGRFASREAGAKALRAAFTGEAK